MCSRCDQASSIGFAPVLLLNEENRRLRQHIQALAAGNASRRKEIAMTTRVGGFQPHTSARDRRQISVRIKCAQFLLNGVGRNDFILPTAQASRALEIRVAQKKIDSTLSEIAHLRQVAESLQRRLAPAPPESMPALASSVTNEAVNPAPTSTAPESLGRRRRRYGTA